MKKTLHISAILVGIAFLLTSCMSPFFWKLPESLLSSITGDSSTAIESETTTAGLETSEIDDTASYSEWSTNSTVTGEDSTVTSGETTRSTSGKTSTSRPTTTTTTSRATTTTQKPSTGGEFRGVWLTYLELNTLLKNKTVATAKTAIDSVMDNTKSYGLNTVIFHVRANSDAYYKSSIFKVSSVVQPLLNSGFDPLTYAVESAHKRGLELHAWVNPYRVGTNTAYAKVNDYFLSKDRYYYNPSSTEVQSLILRGVEEIVKNYDVDGIQFDDYFYPSDTTVIPTGSPATFEKTAYTAYTKGGGTMSIGDWRRTQVSAMVRAVYSKIHNIRKDCVFGISPGGVQSKNYSTLYADVATWMATAGYVDYICPQIYYGFLNKNQPFQTDVNGWVSMSRHSSVKLYVGLALYKTGVSPDDNAGDTAGKQEWVNYSDIMKRSVLYLRTKSACSGMIFYRYDSFQAATRTVDGGQTYTSSIGAKEVSNLLSVLK